MLSLALGATLVGFVLLILGLITGTVWLAIACIVVCLLGLGFLVADIVGGNRRTSSRTISDMVPGSGSSSRASSESAADDSVVSASDDSDAPTRLVSAAPPTSSAPSAPPPSGPVGVAGAGAPPVDRAPQEVAAGPSEEGDYADYLRSVGAADVVDSDRFQAPGAPGAPGRPGGEQTPRRPDGMAPQQQWGAPGPTPPRPGGMPPQYGRPPGGGQWGPPGPPQGAGRPGPNRPPQDFAGSQDPRRYPEQQRPSEQHRPAGQQRPQEPQRRRIDPLDPEWRPPSDSADD